MLERILNRLFAREEMDGDGRCPTYLVRWTLLKLPGKRGIYLHHFVGDDWSLDLHDHPKRFISIGLSGRYIEHTPGPAIEGRWEIAPSHDGVMLHLRWSLPSADGRYMWVQHYPNTPWAEAALERIEREWNSPAGRRVIWEWPRSVDIPTTIPSTVQREYRAPWLRTFPAAHRHRITLIDHKPCWTLVVVLKTVRAWGFWHADQWVPWRKYVGSEAATRMRSCAE